MNIQSHNNVSCITDSSRRVTIINGIEYPWAKGMRGRSVSQINGKSYIDGYELIDGEWKRTFLALFHLFF